MSYLFRSVGGVIGISLTSAIFQGIVKHILVEKITGPNADLVSQVKSLPIIHQIDTLFILFTVY